MTDLPSLFRRLFTGLYALLTFTFVALVAYAATAGAFGNYSNDPSSIDASDCESRLRLLHDELITAGTIQMQPYREERLPTWIASEQKWGQKLDVLKHGCNRLDFRQQIQSMRQLQQAYTTAIRGFETRGRDAILRLQSTHGQGQK